MVIYKMITLEMEIVRILFIYILTFTKALSHTYFFKKNKKCENRDYFYI